MKNLVEFTEKIDFGKDIFHTGLAINKDSLFNPVVTGALTGVEVETSIRYFYLLATPQMTCARTRSGHVLCAQIGGLIIHGFHTHEWAFCSRNCGTVANLCHYLPKEKKGFGPYGLLLQLLADHPGTAEIIRKNIENWNAACAAGQRWILATGESGTPSGFTNKFSE